MAFWTCGDFWVLPLTLWTLQAWAAALACESHISILWIRPSHLDSGVCSCTSPNPTSAPHPTLSLSSCCISSVILTGKWGWKMMPVAILVRAVVLGAGVSGVPLCLPLPCNQLAGACHLQLLGLGGSAEILGRNNIEETKAVMYHMGGLLTKVFCKEPEPCQAAFRLLKGK